MAGTGAEVVTGTAEFTGLDEPRVDGGQLRFRHALIATGSAPTLPRVPGLPDVDPLTSEAAGWRWSSRRSAGSIANGDAVTSLGPSRRPGTRIR